MKSKIKICSLCKQKTDIYTNAHKNTPFVDGKLYAEMCFTCYFVPKISEQKYKKDGSLLEESPLPYSCQNLQTPKELYEQGASDSLKYAKICVSAVLDSCKKCKNNKIKTRPLASWNVC